MGNAKFNQPNILRNIPKILYGFTNKSAGSFKTDNDIEKNIKGIGLKANSVVWMEQIHGNKIKFMDGKMNESKIKDADGIITKTKGIFLLVKTADCIPIIASEKNGKAVGVVHIGWKGILKDIITNFIHMFETHGIDRKDLLIAAGPHIQKCCYEVSQQRIQIFKEKFGGNTNIWGKRNNKFYLDLSEALKLQLRNLKMSEASFEISDECTKTLEDKYFSFRREGNNYGEIAGFIGTL